MAQRKSSNTRGSRTSSSRGDAEMFVNGRIFLKKGTEQQTSEQLGVWSFASDENRVTNKMMSLVRSEDIAEGKDKVFKDTLIKLIQNGDITFTFKDMLEYIPTSEEDVPF